MLDKIFGALTIVRHAVAITVVTSAAGAMVAGSVDVRVPDTTNTHAASATTTTATTTVSSELEALVKACLETRDPQSQECADATAASGLAVTEFWSKVAMSLGERLSTRGADVVKTETARPETKPTATRELLALVAQCVETHERSSEECAKALAAGGLTPDEFWTRVSTMLHKETTAPKTEPSTKNESTTKTNTEALGALVKDCLAKYESAKTTADGASAASEACRRAIEASGLTSTEFWARFAPKPATTPKPTTRPSTSKAPEATKRPEPSRTPSVSTAQLAVMVKDCFDKYLIAKNTGEGGTAAAEACNAAIAASGLTRDAFFARFGTPGSK